MGKFIKPGTRVPPSNVVPFPHLIIAKDKYSHKWLMQLFLMEDERLMMRHL